MWPIFPVVPSSPSNISTTNCQRSLISWDPPHFTGGLDIPILNYYVNVTSSEGKNLNLTVNDEYIWFPYEEINSKSTYIVCVSAVNCIGASQPTCEEVIMGMQIHIHKLFTVLFLYTVCHKQLRN